MYGRSLSEGGGETGFGSTLDGPLFKQVVYDGGYSPNICSTTSRCLGHRLIAMDWCPIDSVVEEVERSSAFAGGCRVLALLPSLLLLESVSSGRVICAAPGYMKRVGARA